MIYSLFDVVTLVENIPGNDLVAGTVGAIVDIFTEPNEAYLVEFCDPEGQTLALLALLPEQIRPFKSESTKSV